MYFFLFYIIFHYSVSQDIEYSQWILSSACVQFPPRMRGMASAAVRMWALSSEGSGIEFQWQH